MGQQETIEKASLVIAVVDEPDAVVVTVIKDRLSDEVVPRAIGPEVVEAIILRHVRARIKENRERVAAERKTKEAEES